MFLLMIIYFPVFSQFLLDNTESKQKEALFEAKLELQAPEMLFFPSLDYGVPDGFYDLIDGLVGDIYKQASKITRLSTHSGQEHYQVHMQSAFLCYTSC